MKMLNYSYRAWLGILIAGSLLILWSPGQVLAHANLVRSVPAAGATLAQQPAAVALEFSEDLDPNFSTVALFDANGQVVVEGPGTIDPAAPRILRLALTSLPEGGYSAVWRVRSAVDGHVTTGSVGFSFGAASLPAMLLPPPGTPEPATALPTPGDTLTRWWNYLALAVTVGSLSFGLFVWRPVYGRLQRVETATDDVVTLLIRRTALVGAGGLFVGTLAFAVVQAAQASGLSTWEALGEPLVRLLASNTGMLILARTGLLALLGLLIWHLPSAGTGPLGVWWGILALCGGVLLTFSLQSHNAARGILPLIVDWVHLLAMAIWIGGLLPLALYLGFRRRVGLQEGLPGLVRRFSSIAITSVLLLAGTGVCSAWLQVHTFEALTTTSYGRALLIKTGLFGMLILFGAVNLRVLSPRLQSIDHRPVRSLSRIVRMEILVSILVLLAVGVLMGVAPASEALELQQRQGFVQQTRVGDVRMVLRVAPAQIGDNEFGVDIIDPRPGAAEAEARVLLRLSMSEHAVARTQVETTTTDGVRYTARGSYLSMRGAWQIEVILRRPGFDDIRQTFELLLT